MKNSLRLLRGYFLIVPLNVPINFLSDYILQTGRILGEKNKVLFVDYSTPVSLFSLLTVRQIRSKVFDGIRFIRSSSKSGKRIFHPVGILPFQRIGWIRNFNVTIGIWQLACLMWFLKKRNIGVWGFHPHMAYFIGKFHETFSLYDCVDAYGEEVEKGTGYQILEKKIFQYATHIAFNSTPLLLYKKKQFHFRKKRMFVVPCGCNVSLFGKKKKIDVLKKIPKPRFGYIGYINYRVDFTLLEMFLRSNPLFSLVMVGPIFSKAQEDKITDVERRLTRLKTFPNFYWLGEKNKNQVSQIMKNIDVGIVPYLSRYAAVRYCNPMKVYEFLASGKPVVATKILSLEYLDSRVVRVTESSADFIRTAKKLYSSFSSEDKTVAEKIARENSWEKKIYAIGKHLVA